MTPEPGREPVPTGIGGWLLIPTISLFVGPIVQALIIVTRFNAWREGQYDTLFAASSWWPIVFWIAFAVNVAMLPGLGILIYLLLKKKAIFPKLMIALYTVDLVLALVDYAQALQVHPHDLEDARRAFARAGIVLAVWGLYFVTSKRVKATFVN